MTFSFYRAYGLRIKSQIALEELSSCEAFDDQLTDIKIELGAIDRPDHAELTRLHDQILVGPDRLWLDIRDVAVYNVTGGRDVIVAPYPDADPGAVALFLLGSCFGALLWQRGFTVLHGNAIRIGDGVAICVGHSGAGKSTLAAEFARRGHDIISDDVVAIDGNVTTMPGIGRIKLWQKSLDHFEIQSETLPRIRKGEDKFSLKFTPADYQSPLPVRWIFVLQPEECLAPSIEPLQASRGLSALLEHSYRGELIRDLGLQKSHFINCTKILSEANVAKIRRPLSGFQIRELYEAIVAYVK